MQWERLSAEDQQQIQDMALEAAKVSAGGECPCAARHTQLIMPRASYTLSVMLPARAGVVGA